MLLLEKMQKFGKDYRKKRKDSFVWKQREKFKRIEGINSGFVTWLSFSLPSSTRVGVSLSGLLDKPAVAPSFFPPPPGTVTCLHFLLALRVSIPATVLVDFHRCFLPARASSDGRRLHKSALPCCNLHLFFFFMIFFSLDIRKVSIKTEIIC